MPISKILKKEEPGEEDFVEIDESAGETGRTLVPIKILKMNEYADAERIQKTLREGNIVLVKMKTLKEKDMSELKRAIERLRKTTVAVNGEIVGADPNWLILCPKYARVVRSETSEEQQ